MVACQVESDSQVSSDHLGSLTQNSLARLGGVDQDWHCQRDLINGPALGL